MKKTTVTKPKSGEKSKEISITLPLHIWEEIMSACITAADWPEIQTEETNKVLRKTYYQIKNTIK